MSLMPGTVKAAVLILVGNVLGSSADLEARLLAGHLKVADSLDKLPTDFIYSPGVSSFPQWSRSPDSVGSFF